MRRIFGPRREKATGGCWKLHNMKLKHLYTSPHIIRMFKSRMMRWAVHVERMGEIKNAYKTLVVKPEGKDHLWGLGVAVPKHRRLVSGIRLRSLGFVPCGICGGQSGTGTGVAPSPSVFLCQCGAIYRSSGRKVIQLQKYHFFSFRLKKAKVVYFHVGKFHKWNCNSRRQAALVSLFYWREVGVKESTRMSLLSCVVAFKVGTQRFNTKNEKCSRALRYRVFSK
jgi:hypothetical protein